MLPDRYRQLLTAYVDGELTSRQRRHVRRLLEQSPEARRLLRDLEQDAKTLFGLPRPRLDADLAPAVLRAIRERRLSPRRPDVSSRELPAWGGLAAAAAVLLALGLGSYLFFSASLDNGTPPVVAESRAVPKPPKRAPDPVAPVEVAEDTHPATPEPGRREKPDEHPAPPPAPVARGPAKPPAPPPPSPRPEVPKEETVLTDRMEMFKIDRVDLALPITLKVHNLDREPVRRELLAELRKDTNFRLELPCRNGTRGFERLQAAFKAATIPLVIEQTAQGRLKMPHFPTNYVVYLEDFRPEELADLLRQAGAEDKKVAALKPLDAQFDRLVLTRMTPLDHKELSVLMGVDPTQVGLLAPAGALGTDPRQPFPDKTARQVGATLAGQGPPPRPEAGKPSARRNDNPALVLAYNPVRPNPGSPEVKRFLEARKPARPGTLRVLLVLRG
jgi:hypothetical protein